MTTGITYFCTDSHGHTYSRHSANHIKPRYAWAAIYSAPNKPASEANVSYSAKRQLLTGSESVPVRAYPGRHKVEPVQAEVPTSAPAKPWSSIEHVWTPDASVARTAPTSQVYGELEEAYEHFNAELFGGRLPRCLITLQRKNPRTLGYYSPDRFSGVADESVKADEIALNPTHFVGRGLTDVLSTLVHEMTHLEQKRFGKAPRRGYHDKAWGDLMKRVGLYPSNTSRPGGRETGQQMSHYMIEEGPFHIACEMLLDTGFKLSFADRHGLTVTTGTKPKQGRRSKYECVECGLAAWARPEAHLRCADCDRRMWEK